VKLCKTANDGKPFTEFHEIPTDLNYTLKIRYNSILRRIKYRTLKKDIYFNGKNRLRIQVVSVGRSGTKSLTKWLDGLTFEDNEPVISRHETLAGIILKLIIEKKYDKVEDIVRSFPHNVETANYFWFAPQSIIGEKIVLLVRDGRQVVTSGMVRGWYTRDSLWDRIKSDFHGDPFEKSCQLWAKSCDVSIPIANVVLRIEDLIQSKDARFSLLKFLHIKPTDKSFPHLNISKKDPNSYEWTEKQNEIFEKYCGLHMDRLYPAWREK